MMEGRMEISLSHGYAVPAITRSKRCLMCGVHGTARKKTFQSYIDNLI